MGVFPSSKDAHVTNRIYRRAQAMGVVASTKAVIDGGLLLGWMW